MWRFRTGADLETQHQGTSVGERRLPLPRLARRLAGPPAVVAAATAQPMSSTLNPLTWQDPWTLDLDWLLVPLVCLL